MRNGINYYSGYVQNTACLKSKVDNQWIGSLRALSSMEEVSETYRAFCLRLERRSMVRVGTRFTNAIMLPARKEAWPLRHNPAKIARDGIDNLLAWLLGNRVYLRTGRKW